MNSINEDLYKKILNNKTKDIYKRWHELPFSQSECGKLVRSNFRKVKK